jgi:ribokinase
MSKISAIGDINVDIISPVSRLPRRGKQVVVSDIQVHGGGCAANFAFACAKLGMDVKLFGRVGDDLFGKYVVDLLENGGVDVSGIKISRRTGATIALVQGVERSFISYRGENAEFSLKDFNLGEVKGDLVHLPSFFLLEKMQPYYSEILENIDAEKSFDTGWDPGGWKSKKIENVKSLLPKVDLFFPNLSEAERIIGVKGPLSRSEEEKLALRYLSMGVKVVVVTMGERGCIVASNGRVMRVPAYEVEVVDTTGAGDVFNAGFVVGYLKGEDLKTCAEFGSAAAAISVTGFGWNRYPTFNEVESFLSSR